MAETHRGLALAYHERHDMHVAARDREALLGKRLAKREGSLVQASHQARLIFE